MDSNVTPRKFKNLPLSELIGSFISVNKPQPTPSVVVDGCTIRLTGKCAHGKKQCRRCKVGLCSHGNYRNQCKKCGKGFCIHERRKDRCRDCGRGICIHDKWIYDCIDCKNKPKPRRKRGPIIRPYVTQLGTSSDATDTIAVKMMLPMGLKPALMPPEMSMPQTLLTDRCMHDAWLYQCVICGGKSSLCN